MALTPMGDFTDDFTALDTVIAGQAATMKLRLNRRADELKAALNNVITELEAVTDSSSGADQIGMTAITETGAAATVQAVIEALITRLKAVTDDESGADLIGATTISGITGATVQAILEALDTKIKATTDSSSGADYVGATAISELAGATVQALLEALKAAIGTLDDLTTTEKTNIVGAVNEHLADYASKFPDNAGAHNSIYRGKYLGSSVTAEQYTAISSGSFTDLYIGDYWTIGGVNYIIAAFNYYMQKGDTATTVNHVTLVPGTSLYNHVMNDTNITTGGYTGSKMYTEGLEQAKTTIINAFSGHVLNHRKLLSNATTEGKASGWAWVNSEIDLMNEVMVYGSTVWGESTIGGSGYNIGGELSQLPFFALRPDMISNRQTFWLRDVVSASTFANVHSNGYASDRYASGAFGVRPAFSIS